MKKILRLSVQILLIIYTGSSLSFAADKNFDQEEKIYSQLFSSGEKKLAAENFVKENKPQHIRQKLVALILSKSGNEEKFIALQALRLYPKDHILDSWISILEQSESNAIKQAVITHLSDVHDRRLVIPLAKMLKDPFRANRKKAALLLKKNGDDRMYPYILTLMIHKNPVYRMYGLEALLYLYDGRFYSVVTKAFKDPNKSVRIYALECVKKNKLLDALYLVREAALKDENDEVKIHAVEFIGALRDAGSLYVLHNTLTSTERELRYATVQSLYRIKSRSSLYALSWQLVKETDPEIKWIIINIFLELSGVGDPKGVGTVLSFDKDALLRIKAAYLLGIANDNRSIAFLQTGLKDPDYRVRAEACDGLGNYKYIQVLKDLVEIIKNDKKRYVRSAALYSIKKINNNNAILPLFGIYAQEKDVVFKHMLQSVIQWFNTKSFNF